MTYIIIKLQVNKIQSLATAENYWAFLVNSLLGLSFFW
jgi:hypothetical protein